MHDFDGLVALITGGASGIGAATAQVLADRGAHIAVLDRAPHTAGPGTLALSADVTDPNSISRAVAATIAQWDRIDVVVNSAGIGAVGDITANDDDEWHHVWDVNVVGITRVTRASLPHLRRSPSPAVVNVCSIAATMGLPARALYSSTKGAVLALTYAMAADHVAEGIRVNAVAPATVDTPWVQRLVDQADDPAAAAAQLRARQPYGRLITPHEVATAIAGLASPSASGITGTLLHVDAGMHSLRTSSSPIPTPRQ